MTRWKRRAWRANQGGSVYKPPSETGGRFVNRRSLLRSSCQRQSSLCVDERSDEFARRVPAQIFERSDLHHASLVHEHELIAEISGFGQIVRHEEGGLLQ